MVTVDVRLWWLDINQCPQDYFVPNAFKDTARCHYDTTYVCNNEHLAFARMSEITSSSAMAETA